MKKYIFFVVGAVCLLLSSTVYAEDLKSTDANIVGHVIEKSTREHLPYMTVSLKGADRLRFPDQSYLGRYFKKHTGLSPTQYRNRRWDDSFVGVPQEP